MTWIEFLKRFADGNNYADFVVYSHTGEDGTGEICLDGRMTLTQAEVAQLRKAHIIEEI